MRFSPTPPTALQCACGPDPLAGRGRCGVGVPSPTEVSRRLLPRLILVYPRGYAGPADRDAVDRWTVAGAFRIVEGGRHARTRSWRQLATPPRAAWRPGFRASCQDTTPPTATLFNSGRAQGRRANQSIPISLLFMSRGPSLTSSTSLLSSCCRTLSRRCTEVASTPLSVVHRSPPADASLVGDLSTLRARARRRGGRAAGREVTCGAGELRTPRALRRPPFAELAGWVDLLRVHDDSLVEALSAIATGVPCHRPRACPEGGGHVLPVNYTQGA